MAVPVAGDLSGLDRAIVAVMAVCICLLRPSMVGMTYSLYVSAVMAIALAAFLARANNRLRFKLGQHIIQLALMAVMALQAAILAALAGGQFANDAIKGLLMNLNIVLVLATVCSNLSTARAFFDALCIIIIATSVSILITFVAMASGLHWTSLIVGVNNETSYGRIYVLFPYTNSFNLAPTWFGGMPRLSGLYREPGVLPPFACWAAAYAHLRRWSLATTIVPLLASVASLSTLGVPLAAFTGAMIGLRLFGLTTWSALLVVIAAGFVLWPILYTLDHVGLDSKIRSESGSYEARRNAILTGFSASNILFGDGPSLNYGSDDTVNLIGRVRSVGVFGLVVTFLAHVLPVRRDIFIIGVIPMIGTFLLTQPIAGDAAVIAICLSWTALQSSTND